MEKLNKHVEEKLEMQKRESERKRKVVNSRNYRLRKKEENKFVIYLKFSF
jgi:hypothetical protein